MKEKCLFVCSYFTFLLTAPLKVFKSIFKDHAAILGWCLAVPCPFTQDEKKKKKISHYFLYSLMIYQITMNYKKRESIGI